jgi:hypothetical protein
MCYCPYTLLLLLLLLLLQLMIVINAPTMLHFHPMCSLSLDT